MAKSIKITDDIYIDNSAIAYQCMTIKCTDHRQTHEQWKDDKVTGFYILNKKGNKMKFQDDAIIIDSDDVSFALVSCMASYGDTSFQGDFATEIFKNSGSIVSAYGYKTSTQYWVTQSVPPILIPVKKGDVIDTRLTGSLVGDYRILSCFLTVVLV